MQDFWLRELEAAERAEARARALRDRFGPAAEARCADEIRSIADADRRRDMEDVRRALRWT
ncbi:MAG: hypothetical protein JF588_19470 [Caulobacterales bacterium]|nr:hypothetical protein [Caulobacterales bacterium]